MRKGRGFETEKGFYFLKPFYDPGMVADQLMPAGDVDQKITWGGSLSLLPKVRMDSVGGFASSRQARKAPSIK